MPEQPCIVAIGAHAADMEFTAGATVLKHALAGWQAHFVHLTLGEKGHRTLSAAEYGAQKQVEATLAANLLGAKPHFLPFADGTLSVSDEVVYDLAVMLRRLRPDVILTHWRHSMHDDHEACHQLVRKAAFHAAIRHFDLDGLPAKPARLYYCDNWEDPDEFEPYLFVDVSDVYDRWKSAFAAYAIGRGEGGFPYWDWYEARTRLHGIAVGTQRAQAFAVESWQKRVKRDLL